MSLQLLEIYKLLDKSNCGECGLKTCMAFAQAASAGVKGAEDCPHLTDDAADKIGPRKDDAADGFEAALKALKGKVHEIDLEMAADKLGAKFKDGRLSVNILGREFLLDGSGEITSECHVNSWIQGLVLNYATAPDPQPPEGRWVTFVDLPRGATAVGYFSKRCEEPLRVIADEHTDVFFELLGIFGGKTVDGFDADYAVVLQPLPNVPVLVLYWRAEDEFPSKLRVLFDPTADSYLGPEIITGMGRGIVEMFQKIIPKHEKGVLSLPYL